MKEEQMKISTMHSGLCLPSKTVSVLCTSEYCSIVIWFCLKFILTNVQYQATETSVATEGRVQTSDSKTDAFLQH